MLQKLKKFKGIILPSLLVVLVAVVGFMFLGNDSKTNLKTKEQLRLLEYNQVQDDEEKIDGTEYVTFDAFFLHDINDDGEADGIRGTSNKVGSTDQLWIELKIFGDVTLKDATINFVNSNVKVSGSVKKGSTFKTSISSTNITSIPLNNLSNGTTSLFALNVNDSLTNVLSSYSATNKVILKGTVVDDAGNETPIEKDVSYIADWYIDGLTANVASKYDTTQVDPYDIVYDQALGGGYYCYHTEYNGKNIVITYTFNTFASTKYFLKSANIETIIPKLNGYDPVVVKVDGYNITSNYDTNTRILTAKREAKVEEHLIKEQAYGYTEGNYGYNSWKIVVEYPVDAEIENQVLALPITTWYEMYNNQEDGFENILTSEKATRILSKRYELPLLREEGYCEGQSNVELLSNVKSVGKYSSSLGINYINKTDAINLYNEKEVTSTKTNYEVKWEVFLRKYNYGDTITSLTITDLGADKFNGTYSMEEFTKYKSISVSGANSYLGSSGYIKIINNETDEVIHVLTSLDWNNTYTFEEDVRSIRIETSEIVDAAGIIKKHRFADNKTLTLFNISIQKEIDNEQLMNTYTYDEFTKFNYVVSKEQSWFTTKLQGKNTNNIEKEDASYRETQSSTISLELSQNNITTTEEKEIDIKLTTNSYYDIVEGWTNGEFLVIMPDGLLDFDINSITISNSNVEIVGYEKVNVNGKKGIRIITSNEKPAAYTITIKTNLIPNATLGTASYNIVAYGYNPYSNLSSETSQDIYDIDQDGDITERMNCAGKTLTMTSPNEVITTTKLTNYDSEGNISVSPMIGEVNPVEDDSAATVEIGVNNNSSYSTKNVVIIGKLGFVGNTYQVGDGDLGSEFDVSMTDEGIKVPTELEGKVKVYYSEVAEPTDDITNAENGWTLEPTDYSKVKTYMIVLDPEYVFYQGQKLAFTYNIEMPNKTENLLKTTYFTHGVYYDVITNAGTYESSVGCAKLGIMMSRKYDLDLTNYKTNTSRGVYARYLLTDNLGNTKIITTDENGKAKLEDLYVNLEYTLKQINVKTSYELDEEVKTFKVTNNENDELVLTNTGTYKSINYNANNTLEMVLETEPRYTITLKNTDLDTTESISGTVFKLTGKGCEDGCVLSTNSNGEVTLKGLYLNEEYVIEEVKSQKHLRNLEPYKIRLIRSEETNEVAITLEKLPVLGDIQASDYTYTFTKNSKGVYSSTIPYSNYYVIAKGHIPLDLTEFKEKYQLSMDVYIYDYYKYSTFAVYIMQGANNSLYLPALYLNQTYYSGSRIDGIYKADKASKLNENNEQINTDFVGGSTYDIYFLYNKQYRSGSIEIKNLKIEPVDGTVEFVEQTGKENIELAENPNVLQTIKDSDQIDSPELIVEVKSKKVPTYTLELTKKDAETGEVLAGAQYKIIGPGLPETGKYITTDEFGKATIELNKNYDYVEYKLNYIDYTQVGNEYTIEEVVAPVGYMLDNKSITFKNTVYLENTSCNYNTKSCIVDLTNQTTNYIDYSSDSEGQFKEAEYDIDTNTYKVVMEDYPIVTIKKTDAETNELLPNTLFAIYNVEKTGGIEVLTPAKDVNGNIIGDEIIIDGKTMFVVATDENGKIGLNLSGGRYKLIEVQAADEKYEIDDQEYYFGVGETVPYSAGGLELSNIIIPENYVTGNLVGSNEIVATKDGGWITTTSYTGPWPDYEKDSRIIKYDSDGNILWQKELLIEHTYGVPYYTYFDNPTNNYIDYDSYNYSEYNISQVVPSSDGGYFVNSATMEGIFVKLDQNGNVLWQSDKSYGYYEYHMDYYCTYEGNTDENGNVIMYNYNSTTGEYEPQMNYKYNSETGQNEVVGYLYSTLPDYMKRDDETYYCHVSHPGSYNDFNYSGARIAALPNGGAVVLAHMDYYDGDNGRYKILLSDGTIKVVNSNLYLLIYDKDGNFVDAIDVVEKYNIANEKYLEKYNIESTKEPIMPYDYFNYLGVYPNGDILLVCKPGNALKLAYNAETNSYETLWFTPIGANGFPLAETLYNNGDGELSVQLTEDGGFVIRPQSSTSTFDVVNTYKYNVYYSGDNLKLDPEKFVNDWEYDLNETNPTYDYNNSAMRMLRFTEVEEAAGAKQGTIASSSIVSTSYRNVDEVVKYGNSDFRKVYHSEGGSGGTSYYMMDDGSYIVSFYYGGNKSYSEFYRKVELTDGTTIIIDPTTDFIVYKVTPESEIEWVKQYKGMSDRFNSNPKTRLSSDGTKLLIPIKIGANATIKEIGNDNIPVITNPYDTEKYAFLIFDVNQEVTPEGPEAYTLNINNSRKEYKVSVTSNIGSEVKVTDGDKTIYEGLPDTDVVVEKVKYMDDNIYDIKITPEDGYVITSVKVNGEDIGYTVNDDLSITLDKIKEITEDKEIVVTMTHGLSSVIVHHYKENTSERVFSDEIINGMIMTKYETSPQVSNLYSLITDETGEYILPDNMTGTFDIKPIEVTYYYKENDVDLKVNYYINDTEIELAPSVVETKVLGARYQTSALDIEFYELAKVIGEEEGTLESDLTEVTYFYNEVTESEITVKHIDKDTLKEIAESESFVVDRHADYETKESVNKPANYRYVSRTSNAVGKAEQQEIEVIYYYEVIPFDVEIDTKISEILINGEKGNTGDGKLAKIEPEKDDNVIVYYEITVKNTGDIKATMKLEQSEIEGFEIYDLKEFTKEEDKYIVNVELEAGEEKTYKIGYKWNQERYGESDSETKISEVANSLGFSEPDEGDNISTTKIIVGVSTGMNLNIISIIIISIITSGIIVFMLLRRRVRN